MEKTLNIFVFILRILPLKVRYFIYELNTSTNIKLQILIRYLVVKSILKKSGKKLYIGKNVTLKNIEECSFGDNVSIHDLSYIDGYGSIKIGDNVSVAHSCSIISSSHTWDDPAKPIKYNPISKGSVTINSDVWIGCGVRILNNVQIGSHTIIAAGSVVNKNIDKGWLAAGVPVGLKKKIREIK
ncbi:acyltransferase [Mammaliicoccus sciuri]|uniref:acyltransferase n=1 Tax=Mammaliicoccus sciuri TaxID=1296 RepID=UPI0028879388|nr:acyltransferase [Mammaliicoccus sciuri]MDT0695299.1 acyltransferase [Mammaliicoccus sciuri]